MGYTNSSLVCYTKISPNKTVNRNHGIDTISIHCMAGNLSVESCGDLFASSSREASSNYGIGSDGRIAMYVEEKDRSWCTSNRANDMRAVTIEVANDGGAPDWHVSDAAMKSLIKLCADICRRNGIKQLLWQSNKALIGQVDKQNMTVHRWFASKACPGNYLYNKHGYIAQEVNKLLGPVAPVAGPINGFLDAVSFDGKNVVASGWASAGQVGNQAVTVKVFNGSNVVATFNGTGNGNRPDVQKAGYALNSGFNIIGAVALGAGTYQVKAYVGSKQLNNVKTFTVAGAPAPAQPSNKVSTTVAQSFNANYKNGKTYTVSATNGLNIRKGSSTNDAVICAVANGTKVTWYGYYTGDWKYVQVASGPHKGKVGFCSSNYLK